MGAWAGPFFAAALLVGAAGVLKAWEPTDTVGALRTFGIPAPALLVRAGGLAEAVIGLAAILTGAPALAALVALSYLLFTAFVVVALARRLPIGSCGCFGKADTPPSVLHLAVNTGAVVAAIAVTLGEGGGIGSVLADQPAAGVPFLLFVATATYLAYVALTVLPRMLALVHPAGRTR